MYSAEGEGEGGKGEGRFRVPGDDSEGVPRVAVRFGNVQRFGGING